MRVTLKDIAQQADVSVKTVSNVINEKTGHYSQETYDQVMAAAKELGYIPNLAARHLRNGKMGMIALVIPDILNPYFSELSQRLVIAAETYDYTVIIDFTNGDRQKEMLIVNGERPLNVDGIILDPVALNIEDIQPGKVGVPMVLLGERLLNSPYDHVMIDNVAAAKMATKHLIENGRRRIAPIGVTQHPQLGMPHMRYQGFLEAMQEADIPVDPNLVVQDELRFFDRARGAKTMKALLEKGEIPDAVFCFNDLIALGAMSELRKGGYRIPDDIAIIGFDNIQECQYATPPLSSISPGKDDIVRLALSLLMQRISGERSGEPELIVPPFTLVPRESSGQ